MSEPAGFCNISSILRGASDVLSYRNIETTRMRSTDQRQRHGHPVHRVLSFWSTPSYLRNG